MTEQKKENPDFRGSLWERNYNGETYFSGILNGEDVVIWKNKKPKNDKSPHYLVWKSKPKEEKQETSESKQEKMQQIDNILNNQNQVSNEPPFNDDDIPF